MWFVCEALIEEKSDAESLLTWLDRGKWSSNPVNWIFRGQRNAKWCISPSAWRSHGRFLLDGEWKKPPNAAREQCQMEYELAQRFFQLGDVQGLPLPGDTPDLRERLRASRFEEFDSESAWPPVDLYWLLAISQHYGVPTRLIDWTRKPLIAAWFAAEEAARRWGEKEETGEDHEDGRLVIWAIHRPSSVLQRAGWKQVSAPRAAVPNLHLQSGLFTFRPVPAGKWNAVKDVTPLCESVVNAAADDEDVSATIRAASIPWCEAGRLLKQLRDRFVQAATVYAGYEGVAQSVKEQRWRRL